MRLGILLAACLGIAGCVSRGAYQRQSEALARSLDLNRKSIETVKRLEAENKVYRGIYGEVKKGLKEAEVGILNGTRVK